MPVGLVREGHRNNVTQYAAKDYKLDGRKIPFFAKHGRNIPFFCVSSRVLYEHASGEKSGNHDYSFEEAQFLEKLLALKKEARAWTEEELIVATKEPKDASEERNAAEAHHGGGCTIL